MVILYAIPVFMLMIVIEAVIDRFSGRGYYRFNDAIGSLATGMLNRSMNFVTLYVNWAAYTALFNYFSFFQLPQTILVWVVAFVVYDFFYYWSHRLAHVYSLFWNSHAVHHQSEEFNLTTALRQPFSGFVKGSIVFLPMVFMGFDPLIVATVGSLNLIYQFWVHTRYVPKLGWFEWIFVTPSNHRVHHGMNDQYIDKNFGGVFILWDRLFKTFQEELDDEPVIFGVRKQLNSFNPFFANFQIFIQMAKDIWVGRSFKLALQVLMSRTGHRPEAIAEKAPLDRLNLNNYTVYDPTFNRSFYLLVWSQLLFSLGYTVWFLLFVTATPFLPALMYFVPLGTVLLSMCFLLEGRTLGLWVEAFRLFYLAFAIAVLPVEWPASVALSYIAVASIIFIGSLLASRETVQETFS